MRKLFIPIILFFLVVVEGVSQDLLPETFLASNTLIVSHWVFIFLVLVATFFDEPHTYYSVIYALIFGLLIDIVYTDILGVYMIAYGVTVYVIHQLTKIFHANFYMTLLLTIIGIAMVDVSVHLLYTIIGKVNLIWENYAFYRLLPTILANVIFLIIIYPFMKNRLISWSRRGTKEKLFNR